MTTTKYELTDEDRKRLDMIAQKASGKPKVNDIAWNIARDWFASLPVVSREVTDRALEISTFDEIGKCLDSWHEGHDGDNFLAMGRAINDFVAHRRAMLDDATVEPPKVALSGPSREWLAKAADAEDASRSVSVGGMAVDTEMYVAPVEPTPEPQPAIDVVAELAEIRKAVDLLFSRQDAQRGVNKIHAERLDTLSFRVTALESAVQRKPWRWW